MQAVKRPWTLSTANVGNPAFGGALAPQIGVKIPTPFVQPILSRKMRCLASEHGTESCIYIYIYIRESLDKFLWAKN